MKAAYVLINSALSLACLAAGAAGVSGISSNPAAGAIGAVFILCGLACGWLAKTTAKG